MTRTPFLLAAAGALLLSAGCSKAAETSTPAATTTPAAATTTTTGAGSTTTTAGSDVSGSFADQLAKAGLPDTVTVCINGKSDADPSFKAIITSKAALSLDQAKVAMPIILTCVTRPQFATLIMAGSPTPITGSAADCMTQLVSGLTDDQLAGLAAADMATVAVVGPQIEACTSGAVTTTTG